MADSPTSGTASQYQGQVEKVTHLPQILGLLRRILENRALLSVRIPGHQETFLSLLLQVDAEQGFIFFDELNPRSGHELLSEAGQLRVQCQIQGISLSFTCPVEIGHGKTGIAFYKAPLPTTINYLQRRRSFRVRVAFDMQVPVHLPWDEDAILDGELFDLSVGGIGFNVGQDAKFELGQIIDSCAIELPKGEIIQTQLEVRFIRVDEQHRTQRIGASFVALTPQQEHAIRHFATQLEREMLRRKANR